MSAFLTLFQNKNVLIKLAAVLKFCSRQVVTGSNTKKQIRRITQRFLK